MTTNVGRGSYSGSSRAESSEGVEDHGFTERVIDDFEESSSSEEDEYDEDGQEGEDDENEMKNKPAAAAFFGAERWRWKRKTAITDDVRRRISFASRGNRSLHPPGERT